MRVCSVRVCNAPGRTCAAFLRPLPRRTHARTPHARTQFSSSCVCVCCRCAQCTARGETHLLLSDERCADGRARRGRGRALSCARWLQWGTSHTFCIIEPSQTHSARTHTCHRRSAPRPCPSGPMCCIYTAHSRHARDMWNGAWIRKSWGGDEGLRSVSTQLCTTTPLRYTTHGTQYARIGSARLGVLVSLILAPLFDAYGLAMWENGIGAGACIGRGPSIGCSPGPQTSFEFVLHGCIESLCVILLGNLLNTVNVHTKYWY